MKGKSTPKAKAETSKSSTEVTATSVGINSPRSATYPATSKTRSIGKSKTKSVKKEQLPRKCMVVRRSRPNKDTVKTEVRLVIYDKAKPGDDKRKFEYPALMDATELIADQMKTLETKDVKQAYAKDKEIHKKLEGEQRSAAKIPEKKIIAALKKRGSSMCNRTSPISVSSVSSITSDLQKPATTVSESKSSSSVCSNPSQTMSITSRSSGISSKTTTATSLNQTKTTDTSSQTDLTNSTTVALSKRSHAEIEDSLRILMLVYERLSNSKKAQGPEFESLKLKIGTIIKQIERKLASGRNLTTSDLIAVRDVSNFVSDLRRSFVTKSTTVSITETLSTDVDH